MVVAAWAVMLSVPLWWNLMPGTVREIPRLEKPADAKECVLPAARMRVNHMSLLLSRREDVVRRGDRSPVTVGGRQYEKSLAGTCLSCHAKKDAFCDRCHGAVSSHPSCFECHIDTTGVRP
jgi:hypothetical protein